jgi:tetratricopeptide (TPR) repeat protein
MSEPESDDERAARADREVDGLLESLTGDSGARPSETDEYRDEQATIQFDMATAPPPPPRRTPPMPSGPQATPPTPSTAAERPRMPLPGAKLPRPGEAAGPASRSSQRSTAPRPPTRPVPRPTKGLPGGSGIDDAEIDAALMSLSVPPPAVELPPSDPPEPEHGVPSSLAPNPDSWMPPPLDQESLDELGAVELSEPDTQDYEPSTREAPSLARLAAGLSAGPAVSAETQTTVVEEELDEGLEDWDGDRITSVPGPGARPAPTRGAPGAASHTAAPPSTRVEYEATALEDLGTDAEVDSLLEMGDTTRPRQRDTTPAPGSAVAHLGGHRLIDAWVARAEWFEAEAQTAADAPARARLLLSASELWAMSGSIGRSRDAAARAAAAWPSFSLASRQARALAAIEGDYQAVSVALDVETRIAPHDAGRAHAAYLAAEVHRVALQDAEGAERRLEQLARTAPDDPRPHLARLASELGKGAGAPKALAKAGPALEPLARAQAELARLRTGAANEPDRSAAVAFRDARRAILAGDAKAAGSAATRLGGLAGLGDGALLLGAALLAPAAETRAESIAALRALLERAPGSVVRRALAARALEQGDGEAMTAALTEPESDDPAFLPSDRVALNALAGGDVAALAAVAETIAGDEALGPLAAAATSAASVTAPSLPVGDPSTFARIALGRRLATVASFDELRDAIHAVRAAAPEMELGRVLALELDAAASATTAVATELARLAPPTSPSDGKLAAGVIEEAAGRTEAARRNYSSALASPDRAEAAARALVSAAEPTSADLLTMVAASLGDETTTRQALLLFEAAVRSGTTEAGPSEDLLVRAHDAAPILPFASRLGADLARARGDVPKLLEWLRKQQSAASDPVLRALGAVREALLIADDEPAAAAACLALAVIARPDDVALRELEARLSPEANLERGRWRERAAESAALPRTKAWLLYEAASEYERAGALDEAKNAAGAAAESGGSELARVAAAPVPEGVSDDVSRSRAVEHRTLAGNADDELEAVAQRLIDLPDRREAMAHARLAVRLRMRTQDWPATRDLVERVATTRGASLWVLREASAHARLAGDDARLFETEEALAERAERPLDRATLLLRAAEAAGRLGKVEEALALLGRALEVEPDHLVARDLRAALAVRASRFAEAAEDYEVLARSVGVLEHRADAWYRAALIWGDEVKDDDRSLAALEHVGELDIGKGDTFERLQRLYVKRGDRSKLAAVIEARLARTTHADERIALEVTRGRALADIGDRDAARQALGAALEASPDHADALEAYANLALAEGEWKRAEETFIRLARAASLPEKQAEIYGRLAGLYDSELPNPQRAEICYREILKRKPNDPAATGALVRVYGRMGDIVKAVQLQTELVERATDPDEKRQRTLALADVYDEAAKDKKSAFAILEKARRAWPHEPDVLRALARHHERHGETAAQNVLLDRAAAEARRALSHGRFELAFFGILEAVADLRGQKDAASIIGATLAALESKEAVVVQGAGALASNPSLDDLLSPDLLTPSLRALLAKLPTVLDTAYPADLRALRATPLPPSAADLGGEIRAVAESMGVRSLELLFSPLLGDVFLAASSSPARLVIGQSLLESGDDTVRYFLLVRALKMLTGHTAAFSRMAPIELAPAMMALVSILAESFQAPGVDPNKVAEARRKIEVALPSARDPELATLAFEVGSALGNRGSQLGLAAAQWASRTALLAVGSPSLALRGVAVALGQAEGMPADINERLKWMLRQPEARDVCVFSVSDAYTEARKRVGLGG